MTANRRVINTISDARALPSAALLTLSETARITGLNFRTVRGGVDDGSIPSVRIGERFYVPRASLFAMLGIPE